MSGARLGVVLLAGLVCGAASARAEWRDTSPLSFPLVASGERPELVLAQRTIDREWITRTDPNAAPEVPGWRSEPVAIALSAALPGAGQLYAGEHSGFFYALAEAAGWTGLVLLRNDADDLRDQAVGVAGAPTDPSSGWSFSRWQAVTEGSTTQLEALYANDRDAFYQLIAEDPRYQAGWSSGTSQTEFRDLRDRSDRQLHRSRLAGDVLWFNHLVAAVDALRAARLHNLPLRRNLELKTESGWRHGRPTLMLTLEQKF